MGVVLGTGSDVSRLGGAVGVVSRLGGAVGVVLVTGCDVSRLGGAVGVVLVTSAGWEGLWVWF